MDIAAYVLPYLLYVVPGVFESVNASIPGYMAVCTLKGVLALSAFVFFRSHYPPLSRSGLWAAAGLGVLGFVVWICLTQFQMSIPELHGPILKLQGERASFDPFREGVDIGWRIAFIGVRLIELAVVVPLVEEVFWRGFLSRYLIREDFENVDQGTFTPFTLCAVTFLFALVHLEILAAIAWGGLINLLYWRTRNLWSCVLMHSVTNTLLGGYVLVTGSWHLW